MHKKKNQAPDFYVFFFTNLRKLTRKLNVSRISILSPHDHHGQPCGSTSEPEHCRLQEDRAVALKRSWAPWAIAVSDLGGMSQNMASLHDSNWMSNHQLFLWVSNFMDSSLDGEGKQCHQTKIVKGRKCCSMTHPPAVKICPHHPTSMPRVHHQGMT